MRELSFESVAEFCVRREVDLKLVVPGAPFVVGVKAEFDGYGDFFRVLADEVVLVDLPNRVTVGALMLVRDRKLLADLCRAKWAHLENEFPGEAVVIRSADADSWESARPWHLGLLLAERIVFLAGPDWADPVSGRRGASL